MCRRRVIRLVEKTLTAAASAWKLETEAGVVAGVVRVVAGDVIFTGCVFCILLRKGYFADFCNSNGFRLL